jgi:hypothetical protein
MSRSVRRYAVSKDYQRKASRWRKRQASKRVRRIKHIGDGGNYKKAFESWNIFDFKYVDFGDPHTGMESPRDWYQRYGK